MTDKIDKKIFKLLKELWDSEADLKNFLIDITFEHIISDNLFDIAICLYIINSLEIDPNKFEESEIPVEQEIEEVKNSLIAKCKTDILRNNLVQQEEGPEKAIKYIKKMIPNNLPRILSEYNYKSSEELVQKSIIDCRKKNQDELYLELKVVYNKLEKEWFGKKNKEKNLDKDVYEQSEINNGMMADKFNVPKGKLGEINFVKGDKVKKGYSVEKRTKKTSETDEKIIKSIVVILRQKKYSVQEEKIKKLWSIVEKHISNSSSFINGVKISIKNKYRNFFIGYAVKLLYNNIPYQDIYTAIFDSTAKVDNTDSILARDLFYNSASMTVHNHISEQFDKIFNNFQKEWLSSEEYETIKNNHNINKRPVYNLDKLSELVFFTRLKKKEKKEVNKTTRESILDSIRKLKYKNKKELDDFIYKRLTELKITDFELDEKIYNVTIDNIKLLTKGLKWA